MADDYVKGFDELMSKIDALSGAEMEALAERAVLKVAETHKKAAQNLAPVDSGELRGSIHETVERRHGEAVGITYTNSDHAAYLEFGTGEVGAASGGNGSGVPVSYSLPPYKIKRGGKEVMADYWVYFDEAKQQFFATRGQPAQPYMYPSAQDIRKQAGSIMAEAAKQWLKTKGKGGG